MPRPVLLTALLLTLPTAAFAQLTPEKALQSFTVAEGLQLELFAAEPMFTNPTCIDIDHKGRVWVCEAVNYRCHLRRIPLNRKEGDRIVILEDTNGDGKADKATTFYQAPDFVAPLGICIAPNPDGKGVKVYVCHSPHIYVFEDKDGDGKADGPPKILLTGFRGFDHDHGVHGIHFGPDGKLYFSVGDQGVKDLQSADGKGRKWTTNNTDCQAGTVWRCNPDGTGLELLAHNFRNPYEPAVNSFGTMFMSDNDDDGNQQTRICYVMYGGNYGYWPRGKGESHWHEEQPGVVHKALRTGFGSPTGMCWYEGTLLPKKYHGQLLHTDAGPRHLRCYHVKPKGAGYELEQEILVSSTDNWFRPSDVCVAPDGSVFIADWYDPGVGGHGMGDTTRGRIYRLTPKGHRGYKSNPLDVLQFDPWLEAISSPNIATRQMAMRARLEKANPKKFEPTRKLEPLTAVRTFWVLQNDPNEKALVTDLAKVLLQRTIDHEATQADGKLPSEIQAYVVRFAVSHNLGISHCDQFTQQQLFLLENPSSTNEVLLAIRLDPPEFAKKHVSRLMKSYDGKDHFYLAALNIAVGTDPKRREVILADFEKHFPEWNDRTAKLVWELRPPQMIAKLDQKLADPKLTASQKAFILEILAASEGDTAGKVLLKLLRDNLNSELSQQAVAILVRFLPGKWNALAKSDDFKAVVDQLLGDAKTTKIGLQLVAAAKYLPAIEQVGTLAAADDLEAIRTLGDLPDIKAVAQLVRVFGSVEIKKRSRKPDQPDQEKAWSKVKAEVIRALGAQVEGSTDSPATRLALTKLQQVVQSHGDNLELAKSALLALTGSRPGSQWLLDAKAKNELPEELLADVSRLLRNSPFQPIRNKALIAFPPPGRLNLQKLPSLEKLAKRRGNSDRGKSLVFTNKEITCTRCHTIQGYGGQIGPDLSTIGVKGSRENLFESILNPDKAIADQYVQANIETQKGELLTGLVIEETKDYVLLRDANGKDTKIPVKEIVQRAKNPKSIMPSDLAGYLTEADLIDIVEYLTTLKQPALAIEQWHIIGPFPNDMSKPFPPEKGVQLLAEYEGKDGKVKWRTVKPDGNGYIDLQVFFAPTNADIVSYLTCDVESPVDQTAILSFGTDDEAKLWFNGTQVFSHPRHDAATPHRDQVEVKLKQGKNTILLKINNGDGPHGFYFTVLSDQPLKAGR